MRRHIASAGVPCEPRQTEPERPWLTTTGLTQSAKSAATVTMPCMHLKFPQMDVCSDDGVSDTRMPLLVTASVDRIVLRRRLSLASDWALTGSVMWTGRSALDICVQLLSRVWSAPPLPTLRRIDHASAGQVFEEGAGSTCSLRGLCRPSRRAASQGRRALGHGGPWRRGLQGSVSEEAAMTAVFTFVARDPVTSASMTVNPLVVCRRHRPACQGGEAALPRQLLLQLL